MWKCCKLLLLACATFASASAFAQESTPPSVIQEKVQQWVEAKKTLAAERASWAEEQQRLTDLNQVRRAELTELQAVVTNLTDRLDAAVSKRADLEKSETTLKGELAAMEQRVAAWENALRPKLAGLPTPLRDALAEPIHRIENPKGTAVEARVRDLVFILAETAAFHHDLRLHRELREIDGEAREVDVLYLGLAQAYYVNKSGTIAGRGTPATPATPGAKAADGWNWTARNELADDIRRAVDMARKDRAPGMVRLPIAPLRQSGETP